MPNVPSRVVMARARPPRSALAKWPAVFRNRLKGRCLRAGPHLEAQTGEAVECARVAVTRPKPIIADPLGIRVAGSQRTVARRRIERVGGLRVDYAGRKAE